MARCECPLEVVRSNSGHVTGSITRNMILRQLTETSKKQKKRSFHAFYQECKFALVRNVFKEVGAINAEYDDDWVLAWIDATVCLERLARLKLHQRINHFPGMSQICRKDCLATNLIRMKELLPQEYNFFPVTFCLPKDVSRLTDYTNRSKRQKVYIVKPDKNCQGVGIVLTRSVTRMKNYKHAVCQRYISRPLLMEGFKFDLRIYVLVTSVDPLRVYVYKEGLVRLATVRYKMPTAANMHEKRMHLTNYAINRSRETLNEEEEATKHISEAECKKSLSYLESWLTSSGHRVDEMWNTIDSIIVKTILSALLHLEHFYHTSFPVRRAVSACFELLGFDVLLDSKMKPYLLEVNHSPSLGGSTPLDMEIKKSLMKDTLGLVLLTQRQINFIKNEERSKTVRRLTNPNVTRQLTAREEILKDYQEKRELQQIGNYRRIFPVDDDRYDVIVKAATRPDPPSKDSEDA